MNASEHGLQERARKAWQDWALVLEVDGKRAVERALKIPAECMLVGFGSAWSERLESAIYMNGSGCKEWARAYSTRMRGSWGEWARSSRPDV